MHNEPLYLDPMLEKCKVHCVGYIPLTELYLLLGNRAKEKNIQRSSFLTYRLHGIHDLMIKYLPGLFDEVVLSKRNKSTEKFTRTLIKLGYSQDDVTDFLNIFLEDSNTLLRQVSVDFPKKLFLYLDEEEVLLPQAVILLSHLPLVVQVALLLAC